MIGDVTMEVSEQEMVAAIQFYLNQSVFNAESSLRHYHKAFVTGIRQRPNGRFIIDFYGQPEEKQDKSDTESKPNGQS